MAAAAILGMAGQMGSTLLNDFLARQTTENDRRQNYRYGELAAENADLRTRELYRDIYSPGAMLKQYQEAGLSPSIMYGGMPGGGGSSGASAAGAASAQTPYMPMSLLEGAQIGNIIAQTQKTKAETRNIDKDTDLKILQEKLTEMTNSQYKTEFEILNEHLNKSGKETSLYELANDNYTFESFLQEYRQYAPEQVNSEQQIKVLRQIYEANSRFNRDIMTLSQETVSAKFQIDVVTALQKLNYANENAHAVIQQLKAQASTAELTESQKEAWNNLLDRLGKKGSTTRDIIIVLGMILNKYSSNLKLNTGK